MDSARALISYLIEPVYIKNFQSEVEEKVMTLGQQAERRALQETALRMLDEKCDLDFILCN